MTNPQQEAESIRFGLEDIDRRTIRAIREVLVAMLNGYEVPAAVKARLLGIDEEALGLRQQKAVLEKRPVPSRSPWMDPAPKTETPDKP